MLNEVKLIGHVGGEPDVRTMQNGNKVCSFSLATSKHWRDRQTGERREQTEWHRVVCYVEGLIGVIEAYVHKGSRIYVCGELRTRKWTDQGGQERWTTEVVVPAFGGQVLLLDRREGGSGHQEPHQPDPGPGDLDDEIPF